MTWKGKMIMRRLNKLFVACLLSVMSIVSFGQSTQSGYVKEYNEKLAKTPLAGVELYIHNAGSTVSAHDGSFTLVFRTQRPGDRVRYSRIEKLGYEVFNKEALSQWNISKTGIPFVIVMCKSSKFKAIRDNYNKVASASYARQQRKEEDELLAEFRTGKIREETYKKRLADLKHYYAVQFENLDSYIDKFSRIDLNELSEREQSIIEMVQQGCIDEAIAAYERQAFIQLYKSEAHDIITLKKSQKQLSQEKKNHLLQRDSIYASILRQVNTYTLAGGRVNFEKAEKLLRDVTLADTTNGIAVKNYCTFAYGQHHFKEALRFCQMYLATCDNRDELLSATNNLGAIYAAMLDYDQAEKCYKQSLKGYWEWAQSDSVSHIADIARAQCNLGNLYLNTKRYAEAERYYIDAVSNQKKLNVADELDALEELSTTYSNLGVLLMSEGKNKEAAEYLTFALSGRERLFAKDSVAYREGLVSVLHNIAGVEEYLKDSLKALRYYQEALHHQQILASQNPEGCIHQLAMTQNNVGNLIYNMGDFATAERYIEDAYSNYNILYAKDSVIYQSDIAHVEFMLGMLNFRTKKLNVAEKYMYKSLQKRKNLFNKDIAETIENVSEVASALAIIYEEETQNETAEKYYAEALEAAELLMEKDSLANRETYAATLYGFALNQYSIGKSEHAIEMMINALDQYSILTEETGDEKAFFYLSEGMSKAGIWCYKKQLYDKAEALYRNALTCYRLLYKDDHTMMEKVCAGVEINMGILYYEQKDYINAVTFFDKGNKVLGGKYDSYLLSALNSLAYQYAADKNYKDALVAIDRAIAIKPTEANYYDSKGEILLMKGDVENALLMWKKVIECNPDFVRDTQGESELYQQLRKMGRI